MGIFKIDGVIYQAISKFTNMVLLSLCWLLCSIPIVTIGASTAALYAISFKMIRDEEGHIVRGFFSYFKANFRQATISWLILLPIGAIITWVTYVYFVGMSSVDGIADFFAVVIIIAIFLYLICLTYVFACAARYENSPIQTIKNGIFIGLKYIIRTIIIILISLAVVFVCVWNYKTMIFGVILAPGFLCYVHSSFILPIFELLEGKRDDKLKDEEADLRIAQIKQSSEKI